MNNSNVYSVILRKNNKNSRKKWNDQASVKFHPLKRAKSRWKEVFEGDVGEKRDYFVFEQNHTLKAGW